MYLDYLGHLTLALILLGQSPLKSVQPNLSSVHSCPGETACLVPSKSWKHKLLLFRLCYHIKLQNASNLQIFLG